MTIYKTYYSDSTLTVCYISIYYFEHLQYGFFRIEWNNNFLFAKNRH